MVDGTISKRKNFQDFGLMLKWLEKSKENIEQIYRVNLPITINSFEEIFDGTNLIVTKLNSNELKIYYSFKTKKGNSLCLKK